jgi:hypothetical protein
MCEGSILRVFSCDMKNRKHKGKLSRKRYDDSSWEDRWDSDTSDRFGRNKKRNGRKHSTSHSAESDFWDDKWDSDSSDRYGGNKQRNGRRHSIASEFEFNDSDFKGKKGKRKSNRDSSEWSGGSSWENDFSDGRKGGDSGFGGDWSSADMDSFESDENDIWDDMDDFGGFSSEFRRGRKHIALPISNFIHKNFDEHLHIGSTLLDAYYMIGIMYRP